MTAIVDTAGKTLWDLIEARADDTPDVLMAFDESGRTITYRQYADLVLRAAAGLHAKGVGLDTRVSWMLPSRIEAFVLVGALSRLGAVQNPMLPIYRHKETGFIARQTGCRLLIAPGIFRNYDYPTMVRDATEGLDVEIFIADPALPDGDPATLPPAPSAEGDPVRWLFYSSGTTAEPKGAKHSDASLFAADDGMQWSMQCGPDDVSAVVFPITHVGGVVWLVNTLRNQVRLALVETFNPQTTPHWLGEHGVTCAGAGTVFHMAYLNAQRAQPGVPLMPKVRMFSGGGAPKPPQLHYELRAEMGASTITGWGLTEAPILTMPPVTETDDDLLANYDGQIVPNATLRVVNIEGVEVGFGQEGELRAKGPMVCQGYLDSSLDAEAFDSDGWFRTGDLGIVTEDRWVKITGRLKDIIIRKGENISAKEVEDLLYTHPAISDVAVIGLPDPALGEKCVAVVATAAGQEPITLAALVQFCRDGGLSNQKIPEQLIHVDALPRNASGKVLKAQMRTTYA